MAGSAAEYGADVEAVTVALDHLDVRYEPERIVLTVYVGTREDVDSWKTGPAVSRVVLCELDEPVAGRQLVDGSPPPRGARDPLESSDSG